MSLILCNVNADSSEDYAIAVMRKLRDGSEKMMGHLGDEHAMDITALMSMFNSKLLYCRKSNAITTQVLMSGIHVAML